MPTPARHGSQRASFDEASIEILRILGDGGWHKRTEEIGRLSPRVPDAMFGRVKKHFNIKHQQVGSGPGSYFEWHRCPDCAGIANSRRCPTAVYAQDTVK
jgi:hypothetical protein